jgi:hypothetical protein
MFFAVLKVNVFVNLINLFANIDLERWQSIEVSNDTPEKRELRSKIFKVKATIIDFWIFIKFSQNLVSILIRDRDASGSSIQKTCFNWKFATATNR